MRSSSAADTISAGLTELRSDRKAHFIIDNHILAEYNYFGIKFPNLIVIVDDAVRRDEALCEGAIGWRSTVKEVEVLYLYDEFVKESGLRFVPTANCDTAYYVDPHDRSQFIRVDGLFERTQQEKQFAYQREFKADNRCKE